MLDLKGKRVLVMGLGLHGGGLGVTRFLLRQEAEVIVTDLRKPDELAPSLQALAGEPVRYVLGEHRLEDFRSADLVVRNPGVPRESPYLEEARRHSVPIEMEMTLFFALCPGPILAITGTKGKSTTTALLGEVLRQQYPDAVVAGNIRVSALETLPQITPNTPVILELSSWQLEGLGERGVSPHVAVVTNIYPDHLNRYPSWQSYVEAKQLIYRFQRARDVLVLNANDPTVRGFAQDAPSRVAWFGLGLHKNGGALHAADGKVLPLAAGAALEDRGQVAWADGQGAVVPICPLDDIALPGAHNRENVLAATAASCMFGLRGPQIAAGITSFRGLDDRLEVVRVIDGVAYVNDTTSTAPASTVAALQALSGPIVLIAGGADKGLDYSEMAQVIAGRARSVLLLEGSATNKLEQAMSQAGASVLIAGRFSDLAIAVQKAQALAAPGDTVLLSPGCASFGMFLHEFDRGQRFRQAVDALAEGAPSGGNGSTGHPR